MRRRERANAFCEAIRALDATGMSSFCEHFTCFLLLAHQDYGLSVSVRSCDCFLNRSYFGGINHVSLTIENFSSDCVGSLKEFP